MTKILNNHQNLIKQTHRFTKEQLRYFTQLDEKGVKVSQWIRLAVDEKIKRETTK